MVMTKQAKNSGDHAEPLYACVKQMIMNRIQAGAWRPGHKIPSESALVDEFGASRMTVNRALRELSIEGAIVRMQGVGSFVAEPKLKSNILEVRNLADEIRARGNRHAARVILMEAVTATAEIAGRLEVPVASRAFHSVIVHHENEVPLQIEDRYVNPALVPEYLLQNFELVTPNKYLIDVTAWTMAEHEVEAILPAAWEAALLGVGVADPCLLIRRRTFIGGRVVTAVRLLFAGARYRIESRQQSHASEV